jgi:glutaredoxin 2
MESLGINYYNALKKKYEAQIEEAKANLALYFSNKNLASIGEHSDLLAEHDRWIESLANAKDKLETLSSLEKSIEKLNK